ncbi:hypothetical protein FFT64_18690, partial [Clostridioides difficile]|nr:hypothetical protein [Clostridioides difficile]
GETIEVVDGKIYRKGKFLGAGEVLDKYEVSHQIKAAYENLAVELDRFIDNTIDYASFNSSNNSSPTLSIISILF